MHRKNFKLQKPIDNQLLVLEAFLSGIAKNGLQSASGAYTGSGKSQTVLTVFTPVFIIIAPSVDFTKNLTHLSAGNMAFSIANQTGVSFIPGVGFRDDCITKIENNSFTLGTYSEVNTDGTSYVYFIVG